MRYSSISMPANPLRTRVAPLLAWSSPALVLVLLLGFHQKTTPTSTPTSPPSVRSFSADSIKSGQLHAPLARVLRGTVGGGVRSVTVPLTSNRPWQLATTLATHAVLRCGAHSHPVSLVVVAPSDNCNLELSTAEGGSQPWTLRLLP
jgi:hypothetical protein